MNLDYDINQYAGQIEELLKSVKKLKSGGDEVLS